MALIYKLHKKGAKKPFKKCQKGTLICAFQQIIKKVQKMFT